MNNKIKTGFYRFRTDTSVRNLKTDEDYVIPKNSVVKFKKISFDLKRHAIIMGIDNNKNKFLIVSIPTDFPEDWVHYCFEYAEEANNKRRHLFGWLFNGDNTIMIRHSLIVLLSFAIITLMYRITFI